jgi:hypothetical protein
VKTILNLLLLLMLTGCSFWGQPMEQRPADFQVVYEWREGSLPPPYHYEYTIRFLPDGAAEMTLTPDYPSEGVPVWTESFTLTPDALDELYAVLVKQKLFTRSWQEEDDPPVGGSVEWITVTANGSQVRLPAFVIPDQQKAVWLIYAAVNELVPAEVRQRLEDLRQEYMLENGG